ncbi:MAG: hypothetical protein GKR89_04315 [Candidatus Latescibacteria bacterium]|nr:hypothetical protein [Candidatus Latescibacterota bacterium]
MPPKQFENLYTAILLWLTALLLALANLYSLELWWVKIGLALLLGGMGLVFAVRYRQGRQQPPAS